MPVISGRGAEAAVAASAVESDGAAAAAHDGLSGCVAVAAWSPPDWRTQADLDDQLDALMGEAMMDMHWKRMRKRAAEEEAKKEADQRAKVTPRAKAKLEVLSMMADAVKRDAQKKAEEKAKKEAKDNARAEVLAMMAAAEAKEEAKEKAEEAACSFCASAKKGS